MDPAPASGATPQGGAGARRGGSTTSSSASLAALYAPVIAVLTADRGEQINRVAAMMLDITEARDAETLAEAGDFRLAANHPGAQALDQRYKPLIAILLAGREQQYALVRKLQLQVRAARDIETMEARGIGSRVPGRPAPLLSQSMASMLAPQGGVPSSLAMPQGGPARDRGEGSS